MTPTHEKTQKPPHDQNVIHALYLCERAEGFKFSIILPNIRAVDALIPSYVCLYIMCHVWERTTKEAIIFLRKPDSRVTQFLILDSIQCFYHPLVDFLRSVSDNWCPLLRAQVQSFRLLRFLMTLFLITVSAALQRQLVTHSRNCISH